MAADYPIGLRNGLITKEHKAKMGQALWYFAWLVDRVTAEYEAPDGEVRGKVLGGAVIRAEDIDLGDTPATVRKHLHDLYLAGYIHKQQGKYGFRIEIRNSKKWVQRGFFGPDASGSSDSEAPKAPEQQSSKVVDSYNSSDLTILKSSVPSIKDIAMGNDIAEGINDPSMQETRSSENDDVWTTAVNAIAGQVPPTSLEVLRRCQVWQPDDHSLRIRAPDSQTERVQRWLPAIRLALAGIGHSITLTLLDPQSTARAP